MGRLSSNKRISIALVGLLLRGTVADLISVMGLSVLAPVVDVLAVLCFLYGVLELLRREYIFVVFSTLFFTLLWFVSTQLHPENLTYVKEEGTQFFIYCLPFLWIGYYCVKQGLYLDLFLPVAKVKLILALIVQLFILMNPSVDIFKGDYMTAANSLIVGLMATYYLVVRDKKMFDITLAVVGTLVILLVGSRSSLVAILFFWLVYWLANEKRKGVRYGALALVVLVFMLGSSSLLTIFSTLANSVGYSTHITDALTGEGIFSDESRTQLYEGFMGMIALSPWGYGIMGDRYISSAYNLYWKPIYPHNIFLEILVNFGYIIGTVIILTLIVALIKGLVTSKDRNYKMCVLVLVSSSFIKLLFSSSYWIDQMFFLLLGVLLATPILTKKRKKNPIYISDEYRNTDIS